jgi:hypothetical protein
MLAIPLYLNIGHAMICFACGLLLEQKILKQLAKLSRISIGELVDQLHLIYQK